MPTHQLTQLPARLLQLRVCCCHPAVAQLSTSQPVQQQQQKNEYFTHRHTDRQVE